MVFFLSLCLGMRTVYYKILFNYFINITLSIGVRFFSILPISLKIHKARIERETDNI